MRASVRKHNLRRKLSMLIVMAVLAALLFFSLRGTWYMLDRMREARALRKAAEGNLLRLTEREQELQAAVASLESPRGLEEEVRRRFGVAKPGEGVIEIVEVRHEDDVQPAPKGFWRRLVDWF